MKLLILLLLMIAQRGSAPSIQGVAVPLSALLLGRDHIVMDFNTGESAVLPLDDWDVLDADWNYLTHTLYLLVDAPEIDGAWLYRLDSGAAELELAAEFESFDAKQMALNPETDSAVISVVTPGSAPADDGVGLLRFDLTDEQIVGDLIEIAVDGKTNGLLYPQALEWSPDGAWIALGTIRQPEEEKVSLVDAACLIGGESVCDAETVFGKSVGAHYSPSWMANSVLLAFMCVEADLCVWDTETNTVAQHELPVDPAEALIVYGDTIATWERRRDADQAALVLIDVVTDEVFAEVVIDDSSRSKFVLLPDSVLAGLRSR